MTDKKWLIPVLVLVLAVSAAGAWAYRSSSNAEADEDIAANQDVTPAAGDQVTAATAPVDVDKSVKDAAKPVTEDVKVEEPKDLVKAADIHVTVDASTPEGPRSIGSIDAPVTITEYSSLTCPHCAHAHEDILPQLIKDYVQTGKVRLVFSDFPLNKEALDASKVSRCVANDQYFGFLTLLFGDIEKWAYSGDHPNALITDATLTGLPADKARACLDDKKLEDAILAGVQDATAKGVNSTPTFIFNGGAKTIQGAQPYDVFKETIDALISPKLSTPDSAAPAAPAPKQ